MKLINTLFGNKKSALPRSDIAYIKRDGGPILTALFTMQQETKTMMDLAGVKLTGIQEYMAESTNALNEIIASDKAIKAFNGRNYKELDGLKAERDALCRDFVETTYDRMDNTYSTAVGDPKLAEDISQSLGVSHRHFFDAATRLPAEYVTQDIHYEIDFYRSKKPAAAPRVAGDFTELDHSLATVHKEHTAAVAEGKVDVHAYMEARAAAEDAAFKQWTAARPTEARTQPVVGEHTARIAGHRSAASKENLGEHTQEILDQREKAAKQTPTVHGF